MLRYFEVSLLLVLIFASSIGFAQSEQVGFVFSQSEKNLIPYVNIAAADKNDGVSADANGRFVIPEHLANDTLIFSAIGFKTVKVLASNLADTVWLETEYLLLQEVQVRAESANFIELDGFKKKEDVLGFATGRIPLRMANFYPFRKTNESFPFLTELKILSRCEIDSAKFLVSIVAADTNGKPKNTPLYSALLTARKGKKFTEHTLKSPFLVPEEGYFVIIESLQIAENLHTYTYTKLNSKEKGSSFNYEPTFSSLHTNEACCTFWSFRGGKWKNASGQHSMLRLGIVSTYGD